MDAKALIEEIRTEKSNAVASGILREEKPLAVITDKEKPRELPEGWQWCRLGDYAMKVTDYVASGSFASLKENVLITDEENYAVMVKTADFSNGFTKNLTYTDEHGYKFLENSNLYGGELILSNIGSIGKVFIVPDLHRPMTLASNTVMIRMTHNEYNKYMYYMFLSPFGQKLLMSISSGTSMLKFNKTQLKSTVIPVAPLEQQFQICNILERVQRIISCRKAELKKLDDLIKARFVEMFGLPGTDIKGWGLRPLGSCCELNPKKGADDRLVEGLEISFVPMPAVSENGAIDASEIKLYEEVKTGFTYFAENDVLFAKITPCMENGKGAVAVGLYNGIGFGSTEFHVLRPLAGMSNPFWIYSLTSFESFRKDAAANMTGSAGQRRVPASFLERYKVTLPPLELQKQFADFVQQVDKSKDAVQKALDEAQVLFDSLMQQYFG